jgi:ubiquinone/menaquinone biosynthesis C-methylase UbiE
MEQHEYDTMARLEDTHWWYRALRRLVSRSLQSEGDGRVLRILDVGCGTGGGMASMANRLPGRLLVGVDVEERAIWYASQRRVGSIIRASAHSLPFRDSSFDAVTLIDLLYIEGLDDRVAVREAHRVLREGGLLIVNVAAFEWLRGEHDLVVRTRHRYRKEEIGRLLAGNGFAVKRLLYWNALLLPVIAFARKVLAPVRPKATPRSDIRSSSIWVNRCLFRLLLLDQWLAQRVRLPFGTSIFGVACKGLRPSAAVR